MNDLHFVQMRILRELAFHPNAKFSDLNLNKLSNDHFSYHVRTLIKEGYVTKEKEKYNLTSKGKGFTGHMDTDSSRIERQPKTGVLIIPEKIIKGKKYFLVQTRLKEPYYGYTGFMTGKVRFGEKVAETAAREFDEEMGMKADFKLCFILHEMVYDKLGNQLEDKFFHIMQATNVSGQLKEKTEDGANRWIKEADFAKLNPTYHNELEILQWYREGNKDFKEEVYFIEKF